MASDLTFAEQQQAAGIQLPPPTTITPSSLTPSSPLTPVVTPTNPVPVVSPYAITPQEKKAEADYNAGSSRIADLTAQLDPSFQQQSRLTQESNLGVQQKKDTLASFQNKATQLQAEAQGIQLQLQQSIQAKEQAMSGKGISAEIVGRHNALQTQANQQLLSNSIAQYSNNASLAASQGDLSSALDYVDRAIQAEFLPKQQALATAQANLTNLKNSGLLTSAQQKRADERQAQIDEQKAAIADAKKVRQDTSDAKIKAISNNTGNPKLDNIAMAALDAAKSPEEVAQILAYLGLSSVSAGDQLDAKYKQAQIDKMDYDQKHPKLNTQVIEGQGGHTLLVNTDTGETIKDYGVKASAAAEILSPTEAQTLGVPYGTTKAGAAGMGVTPSKPPTAAQETTALYANRLEQSGKIMDALDTYVATANPISYATQSKLPDVATALKSSNFQSVEQAQRNFVNAILRRESGAVISPSEFDNARKQYFPLPGNPPEIVAQKKANRDLVIRGFIQGAGSAYVQSSTTQLQNGEAGAAKSQIQVIPTQQVPPGYYQANDGLLYKK